MPRLVRGIHSSTGNHAGCWSPVWLFPLGCQYESQSPERQDKAKADGRGDWIRTSDILLPKQALYQTELLPGLAGT